MGCNSSSPATGPQKTGNKKGGKLVLGYLNVRGGCHGNVARFMLAHSGANWEERTYERGTPDWGNDKKTIMDFTNLPYIIDGKFKVSETFAVHQFIAGKCLPSALGTTPQEKARAYQLECIGNEIVIGYTKMCFSPEGTKESVTAASVAGLDKLGNLLRDGKQFLTGSCPVIADFILYEHINFVQ